MFLYTTALKDILRPARLVVWLLVCLGVFAVGLLWKHLAGNVAADVSYGQLASAIGFRVLALSAAVFASMVISQEVEQRTITYLLTRPVPRPALIFARSLAAATATALVGGLAVLASALAVHGAGFMQAQVLRDMGVALLGALAYTSLFVLVSLLVSKSLIYCLLFVFGWESLVPSVAGDMAYLSILTYLRRLSDHPKLETGPNLGNLLSGQMFQSTMPLGLAIGVLVGLIAFGLVFSAWWFAHFEYMPKEE